MPRSQARELAALIPDRARRFLGSRNHILTTDEPAWPVLLGEIERIRTVHIGQAR